MHNKPVQFVKKLNLKKKKKKRQLRISGLWKLFSRLDSNFQKPAGPCQTGWSFLEESCSQEN
jgi:hypothetical protein